MKLIPKMKCLDYLILPTSTIKKLYKEVKENMHVDKGFQEGLLFVGNGILDVDVLIAYYN